MKNLLTLLFLSFYILTSAQDFTITNFDIDLEVNADGSFDVVETIDVYFSERKRGIYREILNTYEVSGGKFYLDIQQIDIQGHEYKVEKNKDRVKIRIGSPDAYVTGNQQYRIAYNIKNGIISYPEHQEFHYDLTGNEWDARIEKVAFKIGLPKSITLGVEDIKITGGQDGQNLNLATINQIDSKTIVGQSTQPLNRRNGLTAAIKLPKSYLDVASNKFTYFEQSEKKSDEKSKSNPWYIAIPLALFGYFYSFWKKKRNTHDVIDRDEIRAYPPDGFTSAHVGAFVDQTAHTRDIVSLIPYWGAEGYIEMKQIGEEVYLYKMKNLPPEFPEYEHIIFDRLFQDNEVSTLSDLKTKFYSTLAKAQQLLTTEVKMQEYYDPEYLKWFRGPLLVVFPLSMLAIGLASIFVFKLYFLAIGFFIAALGGFILPFMKLPLTEKGARLQHEIEAFKRFLKNPDKSTVEQVVTDDSSYFDKMFPFAVAFGLEKTFLDTLQPYMSSAPYWYYTDHRQNSFSDFSKAFKPEVIHSAFSSTPHSSSGGSSGGSFSSGSGVGGGGGGSW